jgi:hypothetical protein
MCENWELAHMFLHMKKDYTSGARKAFVVVFPPKGSPKEILAV